jgi:hypothetical protein
MRQFPAGSEMAVATALARLDSDTPETALFDHAMDRLLAGDPHAAAAAMHQVLALRPDHQGALDCLARIQGFRGRTGDASPLDPR